MPLRSVSFGKDPYSGSGILNLEPEFNAFLDPPRFGLYVVTFSIGIQVLSFNDDIIWNATTAGRPQLRGGRILVTDGGLEKEEVFINRRYQHVTGFRFWFGDTDSVSGSLIGTGSLDVPIYLEQDGHKGVDRIYYGFEPGVQARFLVAGSVEYYSNAGDEFQYRVLGSIAQGL